MNGCIRDEQTTTWFVPDEIRTIRTPLPVLKYGRSDSCFASKTIRNRPDMEFCLRISSREAAAEDTVNGRRFRTPYPHVHQCVHAALHQLHKRVVAAGVTGFPEGAVLALRVLA